MLLHVPRGKTHLPGPRGALCGPAIGVQVSGAHPVTCRRCLKLDEINRGQRPGRRYKKTGQKTRQMLLMGGERRNPKRNGSPRNIEHGLARARYIQQDAQEALILAAQRQDMRAVKKYADQIERAQAAQADLERAQGYVGRGARKRHITPMSYRSMADQAEDIEKSRFRQKLAGQAVGRALAKLRPNRKRR